jgi:hypothetical protein
LYVLLLLAAEPPLELLPPLRPPLLLSLEFEHALRAITPATPRAATFARELVRTDVSSSFLVP